MLGTLHARVGASFICCLISYYMIPAAILLHLLQMYVVAFGMILGAMNRLPIQAAQAGPGQAPWRRQQQQQSADGDF